MSISGFECPPEKVGTLLKNVPIFPKTAEITYDLVARNAVFSLNLRGIQDQSTTQQSISNPSVGGSNPPGRAFDFGERLAGLLVVLGGDVAAKEQLELVRYRAESDTDATVSCF